MKTPYLTATAKVLALGILLMLSACSSAPKLPDWQLEAKGAMDRSMAAYLQGNSRIAHTELARARAQLSSTGRADLMAGAELLHCAARVASLVFEGCDAFDRLRPDATEEQQAYADYLRGQLAPAKIGLLPASQQLAARYDAAANQPLQGIEDPLSLLVASGALLQAGKASPATISQAIETASRQGWRRPLLAWLGVQVDRAKTFGQTEEVERLQRRIKLVQNEAPDTK